MTPVSGICHRHGGFGIHQPSVGIEFRSCASAVLTMSWTEAGSESRARAIKRAEQAQQLGARDGELRRQSSIRQQSTEMRSYAPPLACEHIEGLRAA